MVGDTHVTQLSFFGDTIRHRSDHDESTSYTYNALSSPPTARYLPVGLNCKARMTFWFAGPSEERTSSACDRLTLFLSSLSLPSSHVTNRMELRKAMAACRAWGLHAMSTRTGSAFSPSTRPACITWLVVCSG